jgi:hypothetical protein
MNPQPSADALRRAASILDQIEKLQAQFGAILGGTAPRRGRKPGPQPKAEVLETPAPAKMKRRKKRKLSPEARANIVAAVKARWAREKGRK